MDSVDVLLVGGGVSGLLSALALGKEGRKVLLLERSGYLGGNLRSYVVDGWQVDVGPHALTYVNDGPLRRLMDEYVDNKPEILPYGSYYVRSPGEFGRFPWTVQDWLGFSSLPFSDRRRLLGRMASAMAKNKQEAMKKNLYDVFAESGLSGRGWLFVDALAYFMSGRGMKETPAWRMLQGARYLEEDERKLGFGARIKKLLKFVSYDGAYHQGYPKNGMGSVVDAIVSAMPENVELKTGVEVESIISDNAFTVETSLGEHKAEKIVYSGEAIKLPSLVDGLSADYIKDIRTLKQSNTITVWLGLSEPVKELTYTGSEIWFDAPKAYWGMPTSNYNRSFAKDGGQLMCFGAFLSGDEKKEEKLLYESVYTALPNIEDKVVFTHKQVCVPEKAAITFDARFPKVRTPVDGLYLVGTDADPRSMGATRAAFSVETLLRELGVG